jgi:large subunit ribosomal protein L21
VVHNPEKTISIPAPDSKLFAVIKFKGLQHKVTKDDKIMMEKISELEVGDTFFFDNVLLVASDEYTSVGRPFVKTAKVLATVEEHSLTDKVIVFKKKRRKGYQKNQGHRQQITVVRIMKILHRPEDEALENYHSLIKI